MTQVRDAMMAAALRHANGDAIRESVSQIEPKRSVPSANTTDTGNAALLVREHGHDLRFCHPWSSWLTWRGTHWQPDDTGTVMKWAKMVHRRKLEEVTRELAAEDCDDDRKPMLRAIAAWCVKSLGHRPLKAMVDLARCEVPILPRDLDTDKMRLNAPNGTVDLRTGKLLPHCREDYITRCCPVEYIPDATCETWERCIRTWLAGNTDVIGFVQRSVGYSLTGDVTEQCLYFLYGDGSNGKSTFLAALLGILGDYGIQTIADLLMMRTGDAHPTERADLCGRRFCATIETEDGKRMAEALVKQLTGGDRIRARRMRQDFWEFEPTHKLWLAANHKPAIRGTDYAIWRRIKVIPFTVTIPPEQRDPQLAEKLKAEASGILAWCVRGCLEWQRIGLAEPEEVKAATDAYRAEMDTVGEFIREQCQTHPELRCLASYLHTAYQNWSGDRAMSIKEFAGRVSNKGFESKRSNAGNVWLGIGLPSGEEEGV